MRKYEPILQPSAFRQPETAIKTSNDKNLVNSALGHINILYCSNNFQHPTSLKSIFGIYICQWSRTTVCRDMAPHCICSELNENLLLLEQKCTRPEHASICILSVTRSDQGNTKVVRQIFIGLNYVIQGPPR